MGVARVKSGKLKSSVLRTHEGKEIERYEAGIVIPTAQQQPPLEPLPEPTLADMAAHAGGALVKWAARGFPVASRKLRMHRLTICGNCPYWQPDARLGLGKCSHPKCGCTKAKLFIESERCPLGKW